MGYDVKQLLYRDQQILELYNSYFISGFGAGNNMIDPNVILAMPFNFVLSSNLSIILLKYSVFIMAMHLT